VKRLAVLAVGACSLAGCRNIDRFDTEPGVAYCGEMVSFDQNGFLRPGTGRPNMRMQLELDIDSLTVRPGVITTGDGDGLCALPAPAEPRPLFVQAPLRAIPQVMTDQLSLIEFGDGREYNFFAWVDSSCLGTMVAVVSLMKNDEVELRLLKPKPMPADNAPEADQPGFILFRTSRGQTPCPGI
jgi:hypothetical protein